MTPKSILCLIISLVFIGPIVGSLLDTCPVNYTIERTYSDKQTIINVLKNRTDCKRIAADDTYEMISNDDLLPKRTLVKKNGEYYLSFTWRALAVDGKFPRIFLLIFEYSIPENNVTNKFECVALKLRRRKAAVNEVSSYFSFDCIKLLDLPEERAGTVSIQIWNYSHKQYNGGCRARRALSHSNTCKTVECSAERHFSLSRELYETEICSCYDLNFGSPNVTSEHTMTESTINFQGTIDNLPDFMAALNLTIYRDNEIVWYSDYKNDKLFQSGSAHFFTSGLRRIAGKYALTILRRCRSRSRRNQHYMTTGCSIQRSYDAFLFEVNVDVNSLKERSFDLWVALILIGILAASAVVFVCYKHRQHVSRDRAKSSRTRTDFYHSQSTGTNPDVSILLHQRNELNKTSLSNLPGLLLCHQFDLDTTLRKTLMTLNFKLQEGRMKNWRQFATEALSQNYHILILISEGLLDLISGDGPKRGVRLVERQYENVPEIVLGKLELLIKRDPAHLDKFVHIVSTNCYKGKQLTHRFLDRYECIKSINYCVYYISEDSFMDDSSVSDLSRLRNNLGNEQSAKR